MSYNENEPVLMTASELADYLGVGKNRALIQPGLSFTYYFPLSLTASSFL